MTESREIEGISQEYAIFLNYYQDFLKHYNHCQELTVIIQNIHVKKQTYSLKLFKEAIQAHCLAINSYNKAVEAYHEFRQKVLTDLFKEVY